MSASAPPPDRSLGTRVIARFLDGPLPVLVIVGCLLAGVLSLPDPLIHDAVAGPWSAILDDESCLATVQSLTARR